MGRYILQRLLFSIPTLLVISLFVFSLTKCAPHAGLDIEGGQFGSGSFERRASEIKHAAKARGLDKPLFYFDISLAAFPDKFYEIVDPVRRERLTRLLARCGNWDAVSGFEEACQKMADQMTALPDSAREKVLLAPAINAYLWSREPDTIHYFPVLIGQVAAPYPNILSSLDTVSVWQTEMTSNRKPALLWLPKFRWYGADNQYHRWISRFVSGDMGKTLGIARPVWTALRPALWVTIGVSLCAMLLAYGVAVPLGVWMAQHKGKSIDRWIRRVLLFLYAMPIFWFGALMIMLLATPDIGFSLIKGLRSSPFEGSGQYLPVWMFHNASRLILPVLTLSIHTLAFLALQMRGGIVDVMHSDYIRTARAKGAGEQAVLWRHAFPNALFPIITVFSAVFPGLLIGSLIVESLFSYSGMGTLTMEALRNYDYDMLYAIMMLAAVVTVLGNLIADILYAWADPRVRYQ